MGTAANIWEKITAADILIDQTRCVKVRNRNAGCHRCAEACTTGCIGYSDNKLGISPEKCIGCAACSTACPTDALLPKKPNDAELHRKALAVGRANDGVVVVACRRFLDAANGLYEVERVVSVPCLGRIDETLAVHMATIGAVALALVGGECDTCPYARGIAVAQAAMASAQTLLDAWNKPFAISFKDKLPSFTRVREANYDQSKRAFFQTAGEEARDLVRTATATALDDTFALDEDEPSRFVHVDVRGTLPQRISARRELLNRCLDTLASRCADTPRDTMITTRLMSQVIIDTNICNACRMCATFCPTGANFKFSTRTGEVGVKHRVRQCTNCHLCADICPTQALKYSAEVFARDVSEGSVERFLMKQPDRRMNRGDAVLQTVKPLIAGNNVQVTEYGHSKKP